MKTKFLFLVSMLFLTNLVFAQFSGAGVYKIRLAGDKGGNSIQSEGYLKMENSNNGSRLMIGPEGHAATFEVVVNHDDSYSLIYNHKYVDVSNGKMHNGNRIQMWDMYSHDKTKNRSFFINESTYHKGWFYIASVINVNQVLCMDKDRTSDNTALHLWHHEAGYGTHHWIFEKQQ